MRDQSLSAPEEWSTYDRPQAGYRVRYPADWIVESQIPDRLVLKHPETWAQFVISHLPGDCDTARAALRAKPRLHDFLVHGQRYP